MNKKRTWLALTTVLLVCMAGCCVPSQDSKHVLMHRHPDLASDFSTLYEISLDLWDAIERSDIARDLKFLRTMADLASTEEAEKLYAGQAMALGEGHKFITEQCIGGARRRSDPEKDVLFYHKHWDPSDRTSYREEILITRNGRIRDRFSLLGLPRDEDPGLSSWRNR